MSDPQRALKHWFQEKTAPHGVKTKLAEATGYTSTQISRMRNLETDDPKKRQEIPLDMIEGAARFFQELPPGFEGMLNWLDDSIEAPGKRGGETRSVPIFADVPAGTMMATEAVTDPRNLYGHMTISGLGKGDWAALVVSGHSMNKVAPDGSTIVFNRADTHPVDNAFFIFRDPSTGAATFKRYGAGKPPRLRPYSYDDYDPIILNSEDQVVIIGRVRKVVVDL
jgi:hypothetical protein